ncbi:MAG: J domain-containing protein [Sphingobium sp.]
MSRNGRSNDWGFPRWRSYGSAREAERVRMCDRHGCDQPGNCPAPKSPNSPERWYFCAEHAGEYNRNWDYFQGLDEEERAQRAKNERRDASGFQSSAYHGWGGPGDGSRSRDELHALAALELEDDADFDAVKASWRRLAKEYHPDIRPGDAQAAVRFQTIQAAYEVLRAAEERRTWKPRGSAA